MSQGLQITVLHAHLDDLLTHTDDVELSGSKLDGGIGSGERLLTELAAVDAVDGDTLATFGAADAEAMGGGHNVHGCCFGTLNSGVAYLLKDDVEMITVGADHRCDNLAFGIDGELGVVEADAVDVPAVGGLDIIGVLLSYLHGLPYAAAVGAVEDDVGAIDGIDGDRFRDVEVRVVAGVIAVDP